jgi:hypothetical protein
MPDKKLLALVVLLIALSLGHDFDHIARDDIRWQLLPIVFFVAKYAFLGLGLYFTLKNKLGPLFWAITAGLGVALGWLAHFSPFTDQTPQYIFHAYEKPAAGLLAVAWLVALMLILIITTLYAEYLWARGLRR